MYPEKGVTFISLVITIILLIILAGITLNVTIGENGIFTKAKQAKQNIFLAGEAESLQLNQLYYELETGKQMTEDEESSKKEEIIALLQKQVSELQKQILDLQTQIDSLTSSCAEKEALLVSLQKQIEENRKTIENLQNQVTIKDSTITDLQNQIVQKDLLIANLQSQLKESQNKFTNLQAEYTSFKSTVAQAITEKGVTTSSTDSASVMAQNIQKINSGDFYVYYAQYNFNSNITSINFTITKDTLYFLTNGNWFTSNYQSQLKITVNSTPLSYTDYSVFSNVYLAKYDTKDWKGKVATLYVDRTYVATNTYNILTLIGL